MSEAGAPAPWWESRGYAFALVMMMAVPLLWPAIPPLTDLPGHLGRYEIQMAIGKSASLQEYYNFEWQLIGNLGVDLLIMPLSWLIGLEPAAKLITIAIPVLTAIGMLGIAREIHGRLPPTAALALPLAYGFPFQFGFVNFALSMAFAMLGFWLWLRLARNRRFRLRAIVFVPLSTLIWLTHTFGWGILCILAFVSEFFHQRDERTSFFKSIFMAGIHCLSLALPLALMLAWRSGKAGGDTGDWFNWHIKLNYFEAMLRDRWEVYDKRSVLLLEMVIIAALATNGISFSRKLGVTTLLLLAIYILLPRIVFGSAYADMRLAPFILATALLAIRFTSSFDRRVLHWAALLSTLFFLVRIGGNTISFLKYDDAYAEILPAIDHIPDNARVAAFVGKPCRDDWAKTRLDHLPSIAIVRRHAFTNDQWALAGAQLLEVRYPDSGAFNVDPSQLVLDSHCPWRGWNRLDDALDKLPRNAFDYIWLINPPTFDAGKMKDFKLIWRGRDSSLYDIHAPAPDGPIDANIKKQAATDNVR